ncbi:MAG: flagellar biosynthesis protein FlgF, partial [Rhizobiaceae bacterium]|nr:flagellar biosynthesis protein FlgF [Rhizobiaceae bacterium]
WFGIDTPVGTVMTRDGRFEMDQEGQLVTHQGYPVLDAGGAPIQLDPRNGAPEVGADGRISQDGFQVGAIGLFSFEPGQDFRRFENSGIIPSREPEPIVDRIDVGVAQGFVEDSNVNPVMEMTRLIAVQRAFENTSAMMRSTTSSLDSAVQILGSK